MLSYFCNKLPIRILQYCVCRLDKSELVKNGINMEIIAEIGWNFQGDLSLAERMIKDAKECHNSKISILERS